MIEGIRRSIVRWLDQDLAECHKEVAELRLALQARRPVAPPQVPEMNWGTAIVALEQRMDALCQVCGVEVVVTDNEISAAEISPSAVERVQEVAAVWLLIKEVEEARLQLIRATDRVQTALRKKELQR